MAYFIQKSTRDKIEYDVKTTNEAGLEEIYDNTFNSPELNEQAGLKNKYRLRSDRDNVVSASTIDGNYIVYVRKDNGGYIGKVGWGEYDTYTVALGTQVAPNYRDSGLSSSLLSIRAKALEKIGKVSIVSMNIETMPADKWLAFVANKGRYNIDIKEHPDIPDDVLDGYKQSKAYLIKVPSTKTSEDEPPKEDDSTEKSFNKIFNNIIKVKI